VLFQKISILPPWRFFGFNPHPSGNSSLGSYFPLKMLAFKTPLLLGISNYPLWWGYGYFLEAHIQEIYSLERLARRPQETTRLIKEAISNVRNIHKWVLGMCGN